MPALLHLYYNELVLNCMRNPKETELAASQLPIEYIDAGGIYEVKTRPKRPIHSAQTFPIMLLFRRFHEFDLHAKSPESNPGRMLILAGVLFGVCEHTPGNASSHPDDWSDFKFKFASKGSGDFAHRVQGYSAVVKRGFPGSSGVRFEYYKKEC